MAQTVQQREAETGKRYTGEAASGMGGRRVTVREGRREVAGLTQAAILDADGVEGWHYIDALFIGPVARGVAFAHRISEGLYDVTYQDRVDFDPGVTEAYVDRLARDGYRIEIEHGNWRGGRSGSDIEIRDLTA